jgi:hypothetical protein
MPLKIAAKVDRVDQAYWDEKIHPMVKANANVEYLGEIAEHEKADFLGQASALVFPIDWPEPFGLVMIEAMACGTPVIAFGCGSVPEVVENGVSGFVVESVDQAATVVERVVSLDRASVRAAFEQRFTIERTARDYLEIYNKLIGSAALSTRYQRADGDRRPETWRFNGMKVPGLAPSAIVTKRVRPRGKPSAKYIDMSTKAVVESHDIARSTIPNTASETSRNVVITRRRSNDPQDAP